MKIVSDFDYKTVGKREAFVEIGRSIAPPSVGYLLVGSPYDETVWAVAHFGPTKLREIAFAMLDVADDIDGRTTLVVMMSDETAKAVLEQLPEGADGN